MRANVLEVLKAEGYIRGYASVEHPSGRSELEIELKYFDGEPVIREIERVSKPGLETFDFDRICALRMRVMRSLIGSCVDMSDPPYQLDFTSPGTRPLEPSSRSAMRESLFFR